MTDASITRTITITRNDRVATKKDPIKVAKLIGMDTAEPEKTKSDNVFLSYIIELRMKGKLKFQIHWASWSFNIFFNFNF